MNTRFTNVRVVTPTTIEGRDLLVDAAGRITALVDRDSPVPGMLRKVDLGGQIAFPGMVDVLTHGFGHHLYVDAEADCLAASSRALPRHGVTAFAPSVTSKAEADLMAILAELGRQCGHDDMAGARVLGIHSEGPCFGSAGAHNPDWLQLPSRRLAEAMIDAAEGHLAFVTLAPELPGAEDFCRALRAQNVRVHLGHSKAPADGVPTYADWGVDGVTHIYDVFTPAEIVEPGRYPYSLADACLSEPRLGLGLICDGVHVLPPQVRLLGHLPLDRVFLETDSMKFTGLPPGEFELYPGCVVRTSDTDAARGPDGTLAGSCLTSDRALRNWVAWTDSDLPRASHAASLNPARQAGRDADLGSLEAGKFADFIVLDDDLQVLATYVGGSRVYES